MDVYIKDGITYRFGEHPITMHPDPNDPMGQITADKQENPLRNYRDPLNSMVEDAAGRLEKKARQIRNVNDMLPQRVNREQFESMLALISLMR